MRTTIDLPDELYRRAKAEAALRGRKFKDLVQEGLRRVLEASEPERPPERSPSPSVHDLMRDLCGIAKDAPSDYAINPKYLEGFGR
ncbi:MAG: hypothetical protein JO122_07660 [Acetobacteraceae bacterium]|nr:hypothetical protein [Acetobacteraceae bacterium]